MTASSRLLPLRPADHRTHRRRGSPPARTMASRRGAVDRWRADIDARVRAETPAGYHLYNRSVPWKEIPTRTRHLQVHLFERSPLAGARPDPRGGRVHPPREGGGTPPAPGEGRGVAPDRGASPRGRRATQGARRRERRPHGGVRTRPTTRAQPPRRGGGQQRPVPQDGHARQAPHTHPEGTRPARARPRGPRPVQRQASPPRVARRARRPRRKRPTPRPGPGPGPGRGRERPRRARRRRGGPLAGTLRATFPRANALPRGDAFVRARRLSAVESADAFASTRERGEFVRGRAVTARRPRPPR